MTLDIPALLASLTLAEKASLTSGADFWNTTAVERLGIPAVMLTDGPHGVRKQSTDASTPGLNDSVPATCFPTAAALASSWDPELLRRVGRALGDLPDLSPAGRAWDAGRDPARRRWSGVTVAIG